jgi:C4-dicarboxylate-specific signal transduction histidine kinase
VVNLLHNALDAVEGRAEPRVEVSSGRDDRWAWVEVRDHGPGVPDHLKQRLFEPFVTSKPSGRGTGLGLHIARQLIKDAGGKLELCDAVGGGTLVRINLPFS